MNSNFWRDHSALLRMIAALFVSLSLAACAVAPQPEEPEPPRPPRYDEPGALPVLAYYQFLSRMTLAELGRERMVLAALPLNPNTQIRMAMLFGHPRTQQDLGKSLGLLDQLLKSNDPAAISLQPLARMLADNYSERQKLEGQVERQTLQSKESQRKATELQEKLDALADIERTLPSRSRSGRASGAGVTP